MDNQVTYYKPSMFPVYVPMDKSAGFRDAINNPWLRTAGYFIPGVGGVLSGQDAWNSGKQTWNAFKAGEWKSGLANLGKTLGHTAMAAADFVPFGGAAVRGTVGLGKAGFRGAKALRGISNASKAIKASRPAMRLAGTAAKLGAPGRAAMNTAGRVMAPAAARLGHVAKPLTNAASRLAKPVGRFAKRNLAIPNAMGSRSVLQGAGRFAPKAGQQLAYRTGQLHGGMAKAVGTAAKPLYQAAGRIAPNATAKMMANPWKAYWKMQGAGTAGLLGSHIVNESYANPSLEHVRRYNDSAVGGSYRTPDDLAYRDLYERQPVPGYVPNPAAAEGLLYPSLQQATADNMLGNQQAPAHMTPRNVSGDYYRSLIQSGHIDEAKAYRAQQAQNAVEANRYPYQYVAPEQRPVGPAYKFNQ